MEQYLIDTNIVSDYFSASFPIAGMRFMDTVIDAIPNLSIITQIELLCWNTNATTEQKVKNFISYAKFKCECIKQVVLIRFLHKKQIGSMLFISSWIKI